MAGFLQRGVLLYLCLAIAVCFAAPEVVFDTELTKAPVDNTMLSWFDLESDGTSVDFRNTSKPDWSNDPLLANATAGLDNYKTPSSTGGGLLGWLDPLFQVFEWIKLLFRIIFSPILLLIDPRIAMPSSIVLIIGIPLVIMMIIGMISWIRSGIA